MQRARRRLRTFLLLACLALAAASGQTVAGAASPVLRLKSGRHYAAESVSACSLAADNATNQTAAHFIAVFQTVPNSRDAQSLRALGYNVLAFVPDNGLLVYGNPGADLSAAGVIENYALRTADKLSAKLDSTATGALTAVVQIQPDVNAGLALLRLLVAGATLLPGQDLSSTEFLVQTQYATLRAVAAWDETAYIYPASQRMKAGQRVVPCGMGASGGTVLGVAANLVPTFGDGWAGASHGAATVAYYLHNTALPLNASDVQAALQAVLAEWSTYAAITFTPAATAEAGTSIDIAFLSGDHGDGFPFDPYGAVLAHTFYPPPNPEPIAGDMHLNHDEAWSIDGSLQLYPVMLHEMGHALGLGHSDDPADVMYPYYQGTEHLSTGDIQALRTLYAAPVVTVPTTPSEPSTPTATDPSTPTTTPATPTTPTTPAGTPTSGDTVPPRVQIYSPSLPAILTYQDTLTVQGFASDNTGVTQILWSNSTGGSGSTGVASPFTVTGIPLVPGVNRIAIQAYDAAGNVGSAHLTVTKR